MKIEATLLLGGKTATGFVVPPEVVETLGGGKRPAVRVTIRGFTYRSTIATMGGQFMVPVSAEVRAAAGVAAGDEFEADVELDTDPRVVDVPADLSAALDADPAAREYFETLSNSNKKRHILAIEAAKAPETRQRRIAKSVAMFREGRN